MLQGQGIFVWRLPQSAGGDPDRFIHQCERQRFRHVLIKAADGASKYMTNDRTDNQICQGLQERGIQTAGWGYHYGREPEKEAKIAAQMSGELKHKVYVLNAEVEFERMADAPVVIQRFIDAFRQETGGEVALGLSTFSLPSLHPKFPYEAALSEILRDCDFVMPQIYTVPSSTRPWLEKTVPYLKKSIAELSVYGKPVIPTLRWYTGDGMTDWAEITEDTKRFYAALPELQITAWNGWVWEAAEDHLPLWTLLATLDPASPSLPISTARVDYDSVFNQTAQRYQMFLQELGLYSGAIDGKAMSKTSDAHHRLFGSYLRYDSRRAAQVNEAITEISSGVRTTLQKLLEKL